MKRLLIETALLQLIARELEHSEALLGDDRAEAEDLKHRDAA